MLKKYYLTNGVISLLFAFCFDRYGITRYRNGCPVCISYRSYRC